MTRTAEDLAIQKTVDQSQIFDNARSVWSLHLETSEYRWDEPVSISDELPNGLCPLGTKNFEGGPGPPTDPNAECEPTEAGKYHPVVRYVKGGAKPAGTEEQVEYSLAEEQRSGRLRTGIRRLHRRRAGTPRTVAGTVDHVPDRDPDLLPAQLPRRRSQTHPHRRLVDEPRRNQRHRVQPLLHRRRADRRRRPELRSARDEPDFPHAATGIPVADVSAASQEAGGVEIEKTVRENEGLVPTECEGPATEYVKGLEGFPGGLPLYRPGDEICWRLVVKFAANLYAGHPVVSDFIPTDEEYVKGSAVEGQKKKYDRIEIRHGGRRETEEALEWENRQSRWPNRSKKNNSSNGASRRKSKQTPSSEPGEISGNLMKFVYSNTEGKRSRCATARKSNARNRR